VTDHQLHAQPVTPELLNEMAERFRDANRRHLLLDYDGTLVPFALHPSEASPSQELLALLSRLGCDNKTDLTIISGRSSADLHEWFGGLSINLVAEHGAAVRLCGREWKNDRDGGGLWKPTIRSILELFTKQNAGAFIEEKNHTIAWHYRNMDAELGGIRSRELVSNLYAIAKDSSLQIIEGNKVIEVRRAGVDKGTSVINLLRTKRYDFVLAVGDDSTDEDMFRVLRSKENAYTIKVGYVQTIAQHTVPAHHDVLLLLMRLCKIVEDSYESI
jgi:trehalose 6-phosphate synthase/phosphatase